MFREQLQCQSSWVWNFWLVVCVRVRACVRVYTYIWITHSTSLCVQNIFNGAAYNLQLFRRQHKKLLLASIDLVPIRQNYIAHFFIYRLAQRAQLVACAFKSPVVTSLRNPLPKHQNNPNQAYLRTCATMHSQGKGSAGRSGKDRIVNQLVPCSLPCLSCLSPVRGQPASSCIGNGAMWQRGLGAVTPLSLLHHLDSSISAPRTTDCNPVSQPPPVIFTPSPGQGHHSCHMTHSVEP